MSRNNMIVGIALLGGLAAFLFSRKSAAAPAYAMSPVTGGTLAPPQAVPGSMAPTVSQTSAAAAIWANFTPSAGPTSGYVNFPSGSQSAALFLPWATDSAGNNYTMWAAQIYLVSPTPDMQGNYAARLLGS